MSYKIAVASGKGGTGKTTVSVNLYQQLTNILSSNIQLVDCDVEEPNCSIFFEHKQISSLIQIKQSIPQIDTAKCTFCRKCVDYCEFNAIAVIPKAKFAEVNPTLCHSCGACIVACADNALTEYDVPIGLVNNYSLPFGKGLAEGELKIGSTMQTFLIKELKKKVLANNYITLYDAPPGTSCPVVETVSDTNFVVLVTEPTPFGLYDLQLMVELLNDINKPYGVIINKAGLGNNQVCDFLTENGILLLGEIPFSQDYASVYASGDILNKDIEGMQTCFKQIAQKLINTIKL